MAQNVQYQIGTDDTKKAFTFAIGDLAYSFRYPTTREMRELSKMNQELQKLADGYPDKDGKNTAISGAVNVKFVQVYVSHPQQTLTAKR